MSLSVDGVWKAGVWAETVWADGVWREGSPAATEQPTGGWLNVVARYKTDEERRLERVALGIIPPDEPEAESLIEAAREPIPALAKRALRKAAPPDRLPELLQILDAIIQAQQEARQAAYQDLMEALQAEREGLEFFNRNQNASAVLAMLGLL